jgi:hypothetical protein
MQKILLLISFLCCFAKNFAQTKPPAIDNKDSTAILQDLMDILGDAKSAGSFISVNLGIGNRIFNVKNNVLNSKLTPVNTIIFSPSLTYHHKSGLYVAGTVNLLNDSKHGFGVNEYSAAAGYELPENTKVDFTIAYTHTFVSDIFSSYASPVHNDLYAAYLYKKTWLRPGLALDFSGGEYGEVKRVRLLYDSINSKLTSFTLVPAVSHEFEWDEIFSKSDGITLTPSLLLNLGKSRQVLHHTTNAPNLLSFLNKKGRLPKLENTKFQPESLGFSLNTSYGTGKFSVEPEMYIDYYLPKTTDNRWTDYFTVTFRYSFQ